MLQSLRPHKPTGRCPDDCVHFVSEMPTQQTNGKEPPRRIPNTTTNGRANCRRNFKLQLFAPPVAHFARSAFHLCAVHKTNPSRPTVERCVSPRPACSPGRPLTPALPGREEMMTALDRARCAVCCRAERKTAVFKGNVCLLSSNLPVSLSWAIRSY